MSTIDPSLEMGLPELAYGSVWLVSAGDRDPRHLSPLAVHSLGTADAVIHDPEDSLAHSADCRRASYRRGADRSPTDP